MSSQPEHGGANTNRAGFTLIELLIAAALGVLLIAAVVVAFTGGVRVWERAREGTSPALDAALATEWFQRDLHNSTATRWGTFEGERDAVRFPVLITVTGAPGALALQDVSYAVPTGRGTLERSVGSFPRNGHPAAGDVLVTGLESVRFSYRDGTAGEWLAAWMGRTNRPSAVGIVLQFTHDRGGLEIRRTMLIPGV